MKEVFFYGNIFNVDTDDDEKAISMVLEFINDNPKDYCEVRERKEVESKKK